MKKFIIILVFFITSFSYATNIRGRISYYQDETTNIPVENITVVLIKEGENYNTGYETLTLDDGMYYFFKIEPGKYNLVISRKQHLNNSSERIFIIDVISIEIPNLDNDQSIFFDVLEYILKKKN